MSELEIAVLGRKKQKDSGIKLFNRNMPEHELRDAFLILKLKLGLSEVSIT